MEPIELLGHMVLWFLCILYQLIADIRNQEPKQELETVGLLYGQYFWYGVFAFMYLLPIEIAYWVLLSIVS